MPSSEYVRRYPVGRGSARSGVYFRVWAPIRSRVEVVVEAGRRCAPSGSGGLLLGFIDGRRRHKHHSASTTARASSRPGLALPTRRAAWTVTGRRSQRVRLNDREWRGVSPEGQVLLRIARRHVHAGRNLAAATERLLGVGRAGITAIEVMPVADFRPVRLGIRRHRAFAPTRLLRHARRVPAVR